MNRAVGGGALARLGMELGDVVTEEAGSDLSLLDGFVVEALAWVAVIDDALDGSDGKLASVRGDEEDSVVTTGKDALDDSDLLTEGREEGGGRVAGERGFLLDEHDDE